MQATCSGEAFPRFVIFLVVAGWPGALRAEAKRSFVRGCSGAALRWVGLKNKKRFVGGGLLWGGRAFDGVGSN